MVWDCLIAWVVVVFTVVGWSTGLVRLWTVPVSMVIATFVSQLVYIDLATVLVETLHLEPTFAVFAGYFVTWLGLVQYCDAFLSTMVDTPSGPPWLILRLGGAALGFAKGFGAFVLAAMVAYAQNSVPEPPHVAWQNRWIIHAASDSILLPKIHLVANELDHPIGKYVLSAAAPRFRPNFSLGDDPFAEQEKKEEERGLEFVRRWKRFQAEMGQ